AKITKKVEFTFKAIYPRNKNKAYEILSTFLKETDKRSVFHVIYNNLAKYVNYPPLGYSGVGKYEGDGYKGLPYPHLFVCPTISKELLNYIKKYYPTSTTYPLSSYGPSIYSAFGSIQPDGVRRMKYSRIKRPSEKIWIIDGKGYQTGFPDSYYINPGPEDVLVAQWQYRAFHNGGMNALYFDMSCKWLKLDTVIGYAKNRNIGSPLYYYEY
ncbi:MAG: hypothetical protein ACP5OB_08050, partial [Candidatus Ratteibacteria bacterium]